MKAPYVSILLPCRNAGATVVPALQSMIGQSFADFEVLFLDDGSADHSVSLAESFRDSRIRVLRASESVGLPRRLNQGVSEARGTYIARMDADDLSFPDRLAKQVAFLDAHPDVDLVGCRVVTFRDTGDVVGLLPFSADHDSLCARPWRHIPLPHASWVGRREWFKAHPYRVPEAWRAEDQELLLRAFPDSRYACLSDVLYAYRLGQFNLWRTLLARRHLLTAQLRIFRQRREWVNALKASSFAAIKVAVDLLAALPGAENLFFFRMGVATPADVMEKLRGDLARLSENWPPDRQRGH